MLYSMPFDQASFCVLSNVVINAIDYNANKKPTFVLFLFLLKLLYSLLVFIA